MIERGSEDGMDETDARTAAAKAATLVEALPWMTAYHGAILVVKLGGSTMTDGALLEAFAADIAFLRHAGVRPVVVHGGGPHITRMLERLGIESEFRGGYRVTSDEAMEVVRMVLGGQVARELVAAINEKAPLATAMSGEDAGLLQARRKLARIDGVDVDLGRVGEIVAVDPTVVLADVAAGRIPVVSSIATDVDRPRAALNINADLAAAALAGALGAAKLVMLTDVAGLYARWPDPESLVTEIAADELESMLPSLESGMIPKVEACLAAIRAGVPRATIADGRAPHAILLEIFTREGSGTMVTAGPADRDATEGPAAEQPMTEETA